MDLEVVDDVALAFAALLAGERFRTLVVSGGGTARRCYEAVAATGGVAWPDVEVLVGDERWVPVDHPDSNEGMARRVLLDHVPVASVHSMRGAGPTIAEAAAAYDGLVASTDLDVVHLGLGGDGHTASLFPGSPALDEPARLVVATGDDAHPHPRLTFTLAAIARARVVVFTVAGTEKREALDRVRRGDDVPAARVRARRVRWLVDAAAAG